MEHEHLKDFLQYDYIGSPWYMFGDRCPKMVCNGGLSLRDREATLNITKSFQPNGLHEDLWFCSHLQSEKLPSHEEAKHFTRETFEAEEKNQKSGPPVPSVAQCYDDPEILRGPVPRRESREP